VAGAVVLPELPRIFLPARQIMLPGDFMRLAMETIDRLNREALDKMMTDVLFYGNGAMKVSYQRNAPVVLTPVYFPTDAHFLDPSVFTDLRSA